MMRIAVFFLLLLLAATWPRPLSAQDDPETRAREVELEELRSRIGRLKQSIGDSAAQRDKLSRALKKDEQAIEAMRKKLAAIEAERTRSEARQARVAAEKSVREKALRAEMEQLASQARSAYMNGRQERTRLLLNQQDPATLGRMLRYYEYLSKYRGEQIQAVSAKLAELNRLGAEVEAEEAQLAALARERNQELAALGAALEGRQTTLASLQQQINSESGEVQRLEQQERDLARLVAELGSILADYPIGSEEPFSKHRGRLTWPVAGELLSDFGQPRASGELKWNGVVLGAPRGREVRAIYHGRVVFADWLAGLGLLIIVDHGEGYMSLYGHNDTLLRQSGELVGPGDVIATVGDSGGQLRTSLYFEIREGTKAVDPHRWVTRKPRAN
ncbi:MAG TPA: peptidoglycan DD-metalloendopeptidase family protein [Burkholderiales bacterium]|nr:peptidoglycan DD-metalloendopeptidase family protein [Burkholderiales bacterium]